MEKLIPPLSFTVAGEKEKIKLQYQKIGMERL